MLFARVSKEDIIIPGVLPAFVKSIVSGYGWVSEWYLWAPVSTGRGQPIPQRNAPCEDDADQLDCRLIATVHNVAPLQQQGAPGAQQSGRWGSVRSRELVSAALKRESDLETFPGPTGVYTCFSGAI